MGEQGSRPHDAGLTDRQAPHPVARAVRQGPPQHTPDRRSSGATTTTTATRSGSRWTTPAPGWRCTAGRKCSNSRPNTTTASHGIRSQAKPMSTTGRTTPCSATSSRRCKGNPGGSPSRRPAEFANPPADRRLTKWLSYVLPYVGVGALLFVAVYMLLKAIVEAVDPAHAILEQPGNIPGVARTTLVLFGVTVAARLPRLTRNRWLRAAGIGIAAIVRDYTSRLRIRP